jgi:hypothetical protein
VRYEVQLDRKGRFVQVGIVDAASDEDAYHKAKMWAVALNIPLEDSSLIVKNADGTFKTFGPGEI